jgi:hypothetical protein
MKWDQTLSDRLREMWKHHSSGEIEAMLHREGYKVTRSAVMGRVSRMKLPFGKSHTTEGRCALPKIRRSPRPRIPRESKLLNDTNTNTPLRKMLLDLGPLECRWVDEERNEDGHYTFCACPTDLDESYCAAHKRRSRGRWK